MAVSESIFFTSRQIAERFSVCSRTLDRWLGNPSLGFPKPARVINNRRYWRREEIIAFEAQRSADANVEAA